MELNFSFTAKSNSVFKILSTSQRFLLPAPQIAILEFRLVKAHLLAQMAFIVPQSGRAVSPHYRQWW